ncbi:MAG: sensor histidine kinase [Haloglomus sp.]
MSDVVADAAAGLPELTTVHDGLEGATVLGDRIRLVEAFENLFQNAVDHAGADVTIHTGPLESGRGVFVADDGPGIPPDRRAAVFEHGHTTSADGTGFGLTIVRRIVEAHGWEITIAESRAGGARFELSGVDSFDPGEA